MCLASRSFGISDVTNVEQITQLLKHEYGTPDLGNFPDPIDETVFILLSEKTDHRRYSLAFDRLRKSLRRWDDLLRVPVSHVRRAITIAGMGSRRARLLKRLFLSIVARFGSLDLSSLSAMAPEIAEAELIQLPGIGYKAARCILLYCFGFNVLPVDIHTYRLSIRLGLLSRRVSYVQSHFVLPSLIPAALRQAFHVNAVAHGRNRCFARDPMCAGCPVTGFCSHPTAPSGRPVRITTRPKPLAIDIFAGAGGLSLGFADAGFQVVQAIDSNPHAVASYSHNNRATDVIQDQIQLMDPHSCLQRLSLRPGDLTALIGGIPCQGFSESNRRTRTISNPQNHLYREFFRFVEATRPQWIVLENVAGLRTLARGAILQRILRKCRALGYTPKWAELNAADFGVPQFRNRIFIVGNLLGLSFEFPKPTHGSRELEPYVTVRDAISDLPRLRNGARIDQRDYRGLRCSLTDYQAMMRASTNGSFQGNLVTNNAEGIIERYKHIRQGHNWEDIPPELLSNYEDVSRCHTGIYYRLIYDQPSKVIGNFRKNMLIHPTQNRGLSVREAARLQSFPDDYEFLGSIGFQQQQVADAVPPLLAEAVAAAILRADRKALTALR